MSRVILGDRFELLECLGKGGMAEVYRARDRRLGRDVAIKLLNAACSRDPSLIERFRQESSALAQLSNPRIVTLLDTGETLDGRFYLVMERLCGEPLDVMFRKLKQRGEPMPWWRLAGIVRQVCTALQAAHARQIIHRDIKPSNLFRLEDSSDGEDFIKILDFGIAKILASFDSGAPDEQVQLTASGIFVGTPHYAAPEAIEPAAFGGLGAQVDVYALGVILYQGVAGVLPHEGEPRSKVLYKTAFEEPPPLRSRVTRALAPEIEAVVMRAIARRPEERFASVRELAEAIAAVPDEERRVVSSSAREGAGAVSQGRGGTSAESIATNHQVAQERRRPAAWVPSGLTAVAPAATRGAAGGPVESRGVQGSAPAPGKGAQGGGENVAATPSASGSELQVGAGVVAQGASMFAGQDPQGGAARAVQAQPASRPTEGAGIVGVLEGAKVSGQPSGSVAGLAGAAAKVTKSERPALAPGKTVEIKVPVGMGAGPVVGAGSVAAGRSGASGGESKGGRVVGSSSDRRIMQASGEIVDRPATEPGKRSGNFATEPLRPMGEGAETPLPSMSLVQGVGWRSNLGVILVATLLLAVIVVAWWFMPPPPMPPRTPRAEGPSVTVPPPKVEESAEGAGQVAAGGVPAQTPGDVNRPAEGSAAKDEGRVNEVGPDEPVEGSDYRGPEHAVAAVVPSDEPENERTAAAMAGLGQGETAAAAGSDVQSRAVTDGAASVPDAGASAVLDPAEVERTQVRLRKLAEGFQDTFERCAQGNVLFGGKVYALAVSLEIEPPRRTLKATEAKLSPARANAERLPDAARRCVLEALRKGRLTAKVPATIVHEFVAQ